MQRDRDVFIDDENTLNKFINTIIRSNDLGLKTRLSKAVIVSSINKFMFQHDMDLNVSFDKMSFAKDGAGLYSRKDNKIYIDSDFMNSLEDYNFNFLLCYDSVMQEITQVYHQKYARSKGLDFDKLIMAIDIILSDIEHNGEKEYYNENYDNLSFELDSREMAYVETIKLFGNYKDLIERYKEHTFKRKDNYVRKDGMYYYDVICLFVEKMNYLLSINPNFKKIFDKYPVIYEFFDIEDNKIRFKKDKYFMNKLSELEKSSNSLKNKRMIYSIRAFLMEKRIYKALDSNYSFLSDEDLLSMLKDITKKRGK